MKQIPLLLSGAETVGYHSWPVTQGVPFADGELKSGTPVCVVDEEGRAMPTQATCLTTWNKDLKYAKWLLLDFQADLSPGQKRQLILRYGPGTESPAGETPIRITGQPGRDERLVVDTGVLRLELKSGPQFPNKIGQADVFARCLVADNKGWRDVLRGAPGPFLYLRDQHGNFYDSCTRAPQPAVTIEETGPLRACVCIKGYHTMGQGQRFCPYILRLHLFAGKSDMRIYHTFIYDQDPSQIELSAIGMRFPLDLGQVVRAAIGGSEQAHEIDPVGDVKFLQSSADEYHITANGKQVGQGQRTSGWASLTGTAGTAVGVVRNQWQEYPKGFAIGTDGMDVQIWPEGYRETLKFTTPFKKEAIRLESVGRDEEKFTRLLEGRPEAPLHLKSYAPNTIEDLLWIEGMVEKYASDRAVSHNDIGVHNGAGAAKTTEIYLRFAPIAIEDAEAEDLARAVQGPLIAPADPAHTCATRALGHAYHAGDPRFAKVDAALDESLHLIGFEPIDLCKLYGMMRYGNMVCSHAPGPAIAYAHYKDTEPEKALRYVGSFNNEAYDMIMGVWGHFIRTGRRDHYFLAQAYSRIVADVCIIHADPSNPRWVGLMHYHNAHQWSGSPSPSHTLLTGILTDYYFTGNRRLLDVAEEVADWAVRNQEPCGIISNRHSARHREFTGPLWSVLEVYQATWKEKYGELARRSLNWFLLTMSDPEVYPVDLFTRGKRGDEAVVEPAGGVFTCKTHAREIYPLLEIALRLFDSQVLRDHILADADAYVWKESIDRYTSAQQACKEYPPGTRCWPVDDEFGWLEMDAVWGTYRGAAGPVCLAYDLTGNMIYAAYAKHLIERSFLRQMVKMRHFAFFDFSHLWYGSGILRLMKIVAEAMNKDAEALGKAEAYWLEKRMASGKGVYIGPGVDLSKDKMEVSGKITSRPPADLPFSGISPKRHETISLGRLSTQDHPKPKHQSDDQTG